MQPIINTDLNLNQIIKIKIKMKILNYLSIAACTAMLALGTAACSSDDPENGPDGGIDGGGDGSITKELTPEESKAHLEESAKNVLNKFNPNDQKPLIDLLDNFGEKYGDLDMPDDFPFADDDDDLAFTKWASNLSKSLKGGNMLSLSRSGTEFYALKDFAGEFEPGTYSWVKKADSNDVVFRFTDNGQACELRVTGTGTEWSESFNSDGTKYQFSIPQTLTVTLTKGSDKLVDTTIKSAYSASAHTVSLDINSTLMNLNIASQLNGTDDKVTEHMELNVSGERIITTNATMNGRNLCNRGMLEDLFDDITGEKADRFFTDGYAEVNINGDVQVKANLSQISKFVDALDYDEDSAYNNTAKSGADNAAKTLTEILPASMYYTNSSTVQATLAWEAYVNESWVNSWNNETHEWWSARPVIKFADGTAYAFDGYFGNGKFASVEDLFESILDKYEDIWD